MLKAGVLRLATKGLPRLAMPPSFLQQSTRTIVNLNIWEQIRNRNRLNELKAAVDANPNNERAVYEYLRILSTVQPAEAAAFLERGWAANRLPFNENYLRQYFKAVAALNKLDSVNITGLIKLMNKAQNAGVSGKAGSSTEAVDLSKIFQASSGGMNSGGALLSAGRSPSEPIYVATQDFSWKAQLWKLARVSVIVFMGYSLVLTLFEDKTGSTGGSGIGNRFNMGSAVHQMEKSDKTFDDVVGVDEAKGELQEIVMYLKDPKRFTRLGGKLPKGVLLTGPPGTGKTLLARAIAGEAKVPFFHASGSEFEEMFVGVGAKRVRELFYEAKQKSPCIIFIDEIDAIGGSRNLKDQSAMKMTLNQLLVEMDGFAQNTGIIVIAATNFPDSLDAALIRPGRFDKHVEVNMPDIGGRKAILQFYCKKVPMDSDVDLDQLARGTPGFSGAELSNLINTAALKSSIENQPRVTMSALEYAKDKLMMGAERKSAVISKDVLLMTAYHEAGHALVAIKTDGADPVHKATIMPRGRALGMVMQLPDGDQTSMSKKQMLARLDVCMGGRVAEELIYGNLNVTSGATNDLQQATRLARNMVTKYGLSDRFGAIFIDDKAKVSAQMQAEIDKEVRMLLQASYARAKAILEGNKKELEAVAAGLMEFESLSGSEVVDLAQGKVLDIKKRSQRPSRQAQQLTTMKEAIGPATGAVAVATETTPPSSSSPPPPTVAAAEGSNKNNTSGQPAVSSSAAASGAVARSEDKPATTATATGSSSSSGNSGARATTPRGPPKA